MILTISNNCFIALFKITEIKTYFSQRILPSNSFVTEKRVKKDFGFVS